MAADPLDALRLTLMQDVLPVGMAVVERVRKGGAREVLSAFDGTSPDPLGRLREEGEPAASQLRDNLDRIQPGLGNPVVKVEVRDVAPEPPITTSEQPFPQAGIGQGTAAEEVEELQQTLDRIGARLALLERRLAAGADAESSGTTP